MEIFSRVLDQYLLPRNEIEEYIEQVRSENYEMLRTVSLQARQMNILNKSLSEMEVKKIRVKQESELVGKTLSEADVRKLHGATILAIHRGEEYIPNPGAESMIQADDCLIMIGRPDEIRSAAKILTPL